MTDGGGGGGGRDDGMMSPVVLGPVLTVVG